MFFFALALTGCRCVCVQVESNLTAFVTKQINCCPLSINLQAQPTQSNPNKSPNFIGSHCVQPQVLRRETFVVRTCPAPPATPPPASCNCYNVQPIQLISMAIHTYIHMTPMAQCAPQLRWPKKVGNTFCKQSQAPR